MELPDHHLDEVPGHLVWLELFSGDRGCPWHRSETLGHRGDPGGCRADGPSPLQTKSRT